jgi:hypothetical protein
MQAGEIHGEERTPEMSCRLRVDREPGLPVLEALRKAGHNVDLVSGLLAARSAPADEVFAQAGLARRVLVTADPGYADVSRFEVAESPGLVLFCLQSSTLCDALDSVYKVQLDVLEDVGRAMAEVATTAKRLELRGTDLKSSSEHLYRRAREAIGEGDLEAARTALTLRTENYEGVRSLAEERRQLDESLQGLTPVVQSLQFEVEAFRTEKEIMKAATIAAHVTSMLSGTEQSDVEAITANLIEALASGVPHGTLWLVLPDATWEIPAPYLKGPADVSPRPRRRDPDRESVTE